MSPEEKRAYSKGYNAGASGRWPETKPPAPPDPQVAALFTALRELIGAVDGELGKFEPDDDLVVALRPVLDKADREFLAVARWIKDKP